MACPGYTDQFHFRHSRKSNFEASSNSSIISITVQAQGCKPRGQRRRRKPEGKVQDDQDHIWSHILFRPIQPSYDDVSLCYFVRRFVSPDGGDGFPGHLSFLPKIYDHDNPGVLEIATLSVAQMAAYNQFGGDKFRDQSYRNYGRALQMMRETMKSEEKVTDDKVVTAILLLCTLKDVSGEGTGDPNEHAPGLFYLLEKRGPGQIATRRGAELFLLAHLRLQIYSFLHEDDTYSDPGAIATVLGLFNPLLRAMSMMSTTLRLRHALLQYMSLSDLDIQDDGTWPISEDDSAQEEGESIIQACFQTLDDFETWDAEAAEYWQTTFEGRAVPTTLGEVAFGSTHYDAETACTIILIRSARLILLLSMLLYHGKMQLAADDEFGILGDRAVWAECIPVLEQDVSKTIDDILSMVPYALGDINANGLPSSMDHDGAGAIIIVHSIRLVTYCAYTTVEQFDKSMSILRRINATIGIRSAIGWGEEMSTLSTLKWAEEQSFLRSMSFTVPSIEIPVISPHTDVSPVELEFECQV